MGLSGLAGQGPRRNTNICLLRDRLPGKAAHGGWNEIDFLPPSLEASYCIPFGHDEKNPMLERIAGDLLPAIEALAQDELTSASMHGRHTSAVFCMPIVLTNASLYVARFDPVKLDLKTGILPALETTFEQVPLIRFRKALNPTIQVQSRLTPPRQRLLSQMNPETEAF